MPNIRVLTERQEHPSGKKQCQGSWWREYPCTIDRPLVTASIEYFRPHHQGAGPARGKLCYGGCVVLKGLSGDGIARLQCQLLALLAMRPDRMQEAGQRWPQRISRGRSGALPRAQAEILWKGRCLCPFRHIEGVRELLALK